MKLTDRTLLITGGSAGIGLAFARKFVELGYQIIVTGRRQSTLEQLKASYPKLHTIQSDVADPEWIASLAKCCFKEMTATWCRFAAWQLASWREHRVLTQTL